MQISGRDLNVRNAIGKDHMPGRPCLRYTNNYDGRIRNHPEYLKLVGSVSSELSYQALHYQLHTSRGISLLIDSMERSGERPSGDYREA